MIGRHLDDLHDSIRRCVKEMDESSDNVLEIEMDELDDSIIVIKHDNYIDLLSQIATHNKTLQDDVLLAICGQITGWEDITASLLEVAEYRLKIQLELVHQVILQDEDTYDGTDGIDRVRVSPLGWERYLELREKYESE